MRKLIHVLLAFTIYPSIVFATVPQNNSSNESFVKSDDTQTQIIANEKNRSIIPIQSNEVRFPRQDMAVIPPEVAKWVPWVQKDNINKDCPETNCVFLPQLRLSQNQQDLLIDLNGISFHQDTWIKLPYSNTNMNVQFWPTSITVNGQKGIVQQKDNIPYVKLPKDNVKIQLTYNKDNFLAQSNIILPYAPVSFFNTSSVSLSLNKATLILNKDKQNTDTTNSEKPEVNILVYRRLKDNMPLLLTTKIKIDYSGRPDEIKLGAILPKGFLLQNAQSDLKVYYKEGSYWVSAVPGSHFIELNAFIPEDINYIETAGLVENIKDEIWSFEANPNLRKVQLEAAIPVDSKQAAVPEEWQAFPAWQVKDKLAIKTERRGGVFETPIKGLTTKHSWYGLDGDILQTRDEMLLLNNDNPFIKFMTNNLKIESVKLNDENQLIVTKDSHPTILLPKGENKLQVFSHSMIGSAIPSAVAQAEIEVNQWDLNLAPRYRLLMVKNATVRGSWIDAWSLYSIFFLCLLTIVCWKLLGKRVALLAALYVIVFQTTIIWSWFIWIPLIILMALVSTKTVQQNKMLMSSLKALMLALFIFSIFNVVPFISIELKSMINPVFDSAQTTINYKIDIFSHLSDILSIIAYIIGIACLIKCIFVALSKSKEHKAASLITFIIGALIFLSLPTLLSNSKGSVFGVGSTTPQENITAMQPAPAPASMEKRQDTALTSSLQNNMKIQSKAFKQRNLSTEKIQVGAGEPSWDYQNNYSIEPLQKAKQLEFYIASPLWVNLMGIIQILLIITLLYNILVYIMYVNHHEKWLNIFPTRLNQNKLTQSFIQHAKKIPQGE